MAVPSSINKSWRSAEDYIWEGIGEGRASYGEVAHVAILNQTITSSQGDKIIGLLEELLNLQKKQLQKSQDSLKDEELPQTQDDIIEELKNEMAKNPDMFYAISISERKIIASDISEWKLLNKLGHEKTIKIGSKEYSSKDIFIYSPNEIWFEF